jgi:branched-subunit amino acid transport protein AzlD
VILKNVKDMILLALEDTRAMSFLILTSPKQTNFFKSFSRIIPLIMTMMTSLVAFLIVKKDKEAMVMQLERV